MGIDIMSLHEAASQFNWFVAVGLFVLYVLVEFLDSSLTLLITRHQSVRSASTTFVLYIILGIEVLAFVSNYLYVIPTALGAWLGVFTLLEHEKKVRPLKK
jgi:uncharacterized membrane protein (DUF485 family)